MRIEALSARFAASLALALSTACGGGSEPEDTTPANVSITPSGAQALASGATLQLSPTVTTRGGKALPGATVTWTSSATSVATVSSTGLV
ncbi:MAG TPA: Ig-like domain-containing protein, partial [Gemmatimonadaceae bacterium]|nr:Ig-like domain-containing protein [Gemmatimonadaceae bacterium]